MSTGADAWAVVQVAELIRACERLLSRALETLDSDVRAAMPATGGWSLSSGDAEQLHRLLGEHGELAERLSMCAGGLPMEGLIASYADVSAGAAASLADGILDPAGVVLAAAALRVREGWAALADTLESTDVRVGWDQVLVAELLGDFRGADLHIVNRVLGEAGIDRDDSWPDLSAPATRRLAAVLRAHAERA